MKLKVFSIFDRAGQMFSEPFVAINDAVAVRKFNMLCDGAKAMAPDLQLYSLGTFNQNSGEIEPHIEFVQGYAAKVGENA